MGIADADSTEDRKRMLTADAVKSSRFIVFPPRRHHPSTEIVKWERLPKFRDRAALMPFQANASFLISRRIPIWRAALTSFCEIGRSRIPVLAIWL